jgi:hypothetical protein
MLPESQTAIASYIEMRDYRNRFRQMQMRALKGDLDAFNAYVLCNIALEGEMPGLREEVDFAQSEGGILTDEMVHAAESAIAWGVELGRLVHIATSGRESA